METAEGTYVLRPLPEYHGRAADGGWRRYADGAWVVDDGEWDVAFANVARSLAIWVDRPWENLLWAWTTYTDDPGLAPSARPGPLRHYEVRDPAVGLGNRSSMDEFRRTSEFMHYVSSRAGAANGRPARFELTDPYVKAGLVRLRSAQGWTTTVEPPTSPTCFLCADDDRGHRLNALADVRARLVDAVAVAEERQRDAELAAVGAADDLEYARKKLDEFKAFCRERRYGSVDLDARFDFRTEQAAADERGRW